MRRHLLRLRMRVIDRLTRGYSVMRDVEISETGGVKAGHLLVFGTITLKAPGTSWAELEAIQGPA